MTAYTAVAYIASRGNKNESKFCISEVFRIAVVLYLTNELYVGYSSLQMCHTRYRDRVVEHNSSCTVPITEAMTSTREPFTLNNTYFLTDNCFLFFSMSKFFCFVSFSFGLQCRAVDKALQRTLLSPHRIVSYFIYLFIINTRQKDKEASNTV